MNAWKKPLSPLTAANTNGAKNPIIAAHIANSSQKTQPGEHMLAAVKHSCAIEPKKQGRNPDAKIGTPRHIEVVLRSCSYSHRGKSCQQRKNRKGHSEPNRETVRHDLTSTPSLTPTYAVMVGFTHYGTGHAGFSMPCKHVASHHGTTFATSLSHSVSSGGPVGRQPPMNNSPTNNISRVSISLPFKNGAGGRHQCWSKGAH